MTDKEWYAQISTLVLEGIDQINKGQDPWHNQSRIRDFARYEVTPAQRKAEKRRSVLQNVAEAMKWVGYLGGAILLCVDAVAWLFCLVYGLGFAVPVVMLIMAATLGALGLAGQIWDDLICL